MGFGRFFQEIAIKKTTKKITIRLTDMMIQRMSKYIRPENAEQEMKEALKAFVDETGLTMPLDIQEASWFDLFSSIVVILVCTSLTCKSDGSIKGTVCGSDEDIELILYTLRKELRRRSVPFPGISDLPAHDRTQAEADPSHASSQYRLGSMHYEGADYAEALKWFQKAANQGHILAQHNLGVMYSTDEGMPRNYAEALKWFRKAADQGLPEAQYGLGLMYVNGEGVPRDYAEALKWFRKAAEQGHPEAQYNLGVMYYKSDGVRRDYAEALKWFRKAAEQGDAEAQSNLGMMYYKGEGVHRDFAEALKWFRKAAKRGNAEAQSNLGQLFKGW